MDVREGVVDVEGFSTVAGDEVDDEIVYHIGQVLLVLEDLFSPFRRYVWHWAGCSSRSRCLGI